MTERPDDESGPPGDDPTETLRPETIAIRAGRDDNGDALAPIVWATSTFVTPSVDEGRRMATMVGPTQFYSRYGNPSVRAFEQAVAELEGSEDARAFASGMGAMAAVVLGLTTAALQGPARAPRKMNAATSSTADWAIATPRRLHGA